MFNSKKGLVLFTISIASLLTLGTLPQIVLASILKSGEIAITYDGTVVQPVKWALSVPAAIKLDKKASTNGINKFAYSNVKVGIVSQDGCEFEDSSKDRIFTVNGTSANVNPFNHSMFLKGSDYSTTRMFAHVYNQGDDASDGWDEQPVNANVSNIQNIKFFSSKSGNRNKRTERGIQIGADIHSVTPNTNYSNTISWMATSE